VSSVQGQQRGTAFSAHFRQFRIVARTKQVAVWRCAHGLNVLPLFVLHKLQRVLLEFALDASQLVFTQGLYLGIDYFIPWQQIVLLRIWSVFGARDRSLINLSLLAKSARGVHKFGPALGTAQSLVGPHVSIRAIVADPRRIKLQLFIVANHLVELEVVGQNFPHLRFVFIFNLRVQVPLRLLLNRLKGVTDPPLISLG
jgi:hypothetical protein